MIKPLNNYCLLHKEKVEDKMYGSIVLAKNKKDDSNSATLIAKGEKVTSELLKEGAKVIYKEYSTTSFKDGDEEYLLIKDEDILAVIE